MLCDEGGDGEVDCSERKRKYVQRWRCDWSELAVFDQMESEIEAAIFAIATEKMQESNLVEWPAVKRMDHKIPSVYGYRMTNTCQ